MEASVAETAPCIYPNPLPTLNVVELGKLRGGGGERQLKKKFKSVCSALLSYTSLSKFIVSALKDY